MKLTVIVTANNTESEVLEKTLHYIFESTLKSLEVLVVNYGEADKYKKLKKKFLKADFFDFSGNELEAKCFAIKKATGEYVFFAEPNSRVFFDFFEGLMLPAKKRPYDIVLGDWVIQTKSFAYKLLNDYTIQNTFVCEDDRVLKMYFYFSGAIRSWSVLWNKIIKTSVLNEVVESIEKLENKNIDADKVISFYAFSKSKLLTKIPMGLYFKHAKNAHEYYGETKEELEANIEKQKNTFELFEEELKKSNQFDDLKFKLLNWKRLVETQLFKTAKKIHCKESIENIKQTFGEDFRLFLPANFKMVIKKRAYLPKNIDKIENDLKKAYYSNKYLKIYAKRNSFAFVELVKIKELLNKKFDLTISKSDADIVVTSQKFW